MKYLASLLLASWMIAASPAGAGELVPHRASYLLSLGRNMSGSDVVNVQGVMSFEFADVCEGWTTTQKARIKFYYEDGRMSDVGWNLNAWESKDGERYRFFMRNMDGDSVASEYQGEARIEAPGEAGVVSFESPRARKLTLPRGTLFPTGHSLALLHHAAAGEPTFLATVFDGSDDKGPVEVSAVLAGRGTPSADAAKISPLLSVGPVYRLGLAFFPLEGDSTTPQQEQMVSMYANGIIDRLVLDYGRFTIDAVLKKVEPLPVPGC